MQPGRRKSDDYLHPPADDAHRRLADTHRPVERRCGALLRFHARRSRRSGGDDRERWAGDIGYVVFRATASGWRVALARGGYKVGIARLGGDLVSTQPVYKLHDANCCPTGGFDHLRFHWTGSRFSVARSWHTKTPSP